MPSSVIAFLKYDATWRMLDVVYRDGRGTYRYYDVPPHEYEAFRAASSKGTYLNTIFKLKDYRYEKIR